MCILIRPGSHLSEGVTLFLIVPLRAYVVFVVPKDKPFLHLLSICKKRA